MRGHGWIRDAPLQVIYFGNCWWWDVLLNDPLWGIPVVLCPVNEEAKGSDLLYRFTYMAIFHPGTPVLVNPQWGGAPSSCRMTCACRCCIWGTGQLKCDSTRAETRFRLSAKRTSPLKSAGASVQSTTGSRGVRIGGSNAGYTMFRGSVKGTGYPLHSPVSPSLPLPCVTVCHHISTGLFCTDFMYCCTVYCDNNYEMYIT